MTEPTTNPGWPQTPAAWHVAMACEAAAQRFEHAMHDLVTSMPAANAEKRAEVAKGLLQIQQDLGPIRQPDEDD